MDEIDRKIERQMEFRGKEDREKQKYKFGPLSPFIKKERGAYVQILPLRIFFILTILTLFSSSSLLAMTELRTALVIGNSAYRSGPLRNPVNDATDMAAMLKKLGFAVTLKKNAGQQDMDEAIREFGKQLKKNRGVGLFYYAGHGIQIGGVNYFIPVNARIEKESDMRFQAVNADMVFAEMENAENGLNIVILDACRDNPFSRSFRNAARGLAIISNAPSGAFISYSTGVNQVARDGEGRNSPYTKALLENIDKQGLTINDVFMKVRSKVKRETGQIPWELSSLEGNFYFLPLPEGKVESVRDDPSTSGAATATAFEKDATKAKNPNQMAMAKVPAAPAVIETGRDRRFIAYSDVTVLDTRTNLMWAAKDNGRNTNWADAKAYCESYNGGGYTDWRMPTQDELAGLYDKNNPKQQTCYPDSKILLTNLIDLSCCCVWASETRGPASAVFGPDATVFGFSDDGDRRRWTPQSFSNSYRALPVRSFK